MSAKLFGVIELLVFFGGIMAFGIYQIRAVRRLQGKDTSSEASRRPDRKKSAEDVFWDTVTRPRRKR